MKTRKTYFNFTALTLVITLFSIYGCKDNDSIANPTKEVPTLTTVAVTNAIASTAESGGNITSNGGVEITARGVCWGTNQNPTITDNKTTNGAGTGNFISTITGLTANTPYYVRAYATNSVGTGYGAVVSFTTQPGIEVTYIANSGFLIEVNNKKILIDACFSNGGGYQSVPSAVTQNQLRNALSPFNNCNLVLTTHSHVDHCNSSIIVDHLKSDQSAVAVVSSLTKKEISKSQNISSLGSRLVSVTPGLYNSIDTTINGIRVKVMRLRHSGGDGQEENIGFLVKIDNFTIFHSGDSDGYLSDDNTGRSSLEEYKAMGFENENIDIAFLNRGSFWETTAPGIEIVKQCIKPHYIVVHHFSLNDKQGEWQPVNTVLEGLKNSIPPVTIFRQSLEKKTFAK